MSQLSASQDGYCAPMRREDWAARLADTIAGEVKRYRRERGVTAQQLVDACNDLGLPMKRTVLTNLENGRRGNVTLAELFVLARALGVPPLLLVFPVGRETTSEVLPELTSDTWRAARWFTGEGPFPGDDPEEFRRASAAVALYREHERISSEREAALAASFRDRQRAAVRGIDEIQRRVLINAAERGEERAGDLEERIVEVRRAMKDKGLVLPDLDVSGHVVPLAAIMEDGDL